MASELNTGRGASETKVAGFIPFHAVSLAEVHDRAYVLAPACSHTKCMLLLTRVPQEWEAICANASPFLGKHCTKRVLVTRSQQLCAVRQGQ